VTPPDIPICDLPPCHLDMGVVGRLLSLAHACGSFHRLRDHLAHAQAMWDRYQEYAGATAGILGGRPEDSE
jgi:hypothetical protein